MAGGVNSVGGGLIAFDDGDLVDLLHEKIDFQIHFRGEVGFEEVLWYANLNEGVIRRWGICWFDGGDV